MKKTIIFLAFSLIPILSIGQSKVQQLRQGTRNLETPQYMSLLGDTATKIGVTSYDNNFDFVNLNYSIFNSENKQIGQTKIFTCKGSCYSFYKKNIDSNISFQIVADSALNVSIIQK